MKTKCLSAFLLACCCTVGLMAPAFAASTDDDPEDPALRAAYADEEPAESSRSASSNASGSDTFRRVFASMSYYSEFTQASYTLPNGYHIYDGIDVSYHNSRADYDKQPINWGAVADAGVDFAFIRVAYRGYVSGSLNEDSAYKVNMSGASAAGIPFGVYIFSQALTTEEAVEEAQFVLDCIKDTPYSVDLPIILDYENAPGSTTAAKDDRRYLFVETSQEQKTANALAFCKTISDAGYTPMVYANKNFFETQLDAAQLTAAGAEIWLANYTTATSYAGYYDCWQYSDAGVVPGIVGVTDTNFYLTTGDSLVPKDNTNDNPNNTNPDAKTDFRDVAADAWYEDAVVYVVQQSLMTGTSESPKLFEPDTALTREMVAQILYSFSGKPTVSGGVPFTDVQEGQWYSDAVTWAYQTGVMRGYSDETFGIGDSITRQDFAVVLRSFARDRGIDVSAAADISRYTDDADVSDYALDSIKWAVSCGILSGTSTVTLSPTNTATRAECAQMILKYFTGPAASLMADNTGDAAE